MRVFFSFIDVHLYMQYNFAHLFYCRHRTYAANSLSELLLLSFIDSLIHDDVCHSLLLLIHSIEIIENET